MDSSVKETGITRRIFWILAGSGVGAVAATITLAVVMAQSANSLARTDSERLVASAIGAVVQQTSISTADYALWDEAYRFFTDRDDEAVHDNMGTGATESATFDFIYFLAPDGTPTYAYENDGDGSDLGIVDLGPVQGLLDAHASTQVEPHDVTSAFARVNGRMAVVSVSRVQPYDASHLTARDLPIMVGGLWLSPERLGEIGTEILVPGLTLLDRGTDIQPDSLAWNLRSIDDKVLARVTWPAPAPGSQMLYHVAPILAATSFLLFAGVFVVGRASAVQSASFVREKIKARTDGLTGLMNRSGLLELVATHEVTSAIHSGSAAVIYLDLNGFKALNDEVGHDGGDRALIVTAERLRRSMRHVDTIARLGGDEFVALILDPSPEDAVRAVCNRIIMQTELPLRIGTQDRFARASIGVAVAQPGAHWDDLLIRADAAMYRAKKDETTEPVFARNDQPTGRSPSKLRAIVS